MPGPRFASAFAIGLVRRRRLEELEVRLPDGAERRHDLLRRDLLAVLLEEAEEVPERPALLEGRDGDAEMGDSGDETEMKKMKIS